MNDIKYHSYFNCAGFILNIAVAKNDFVYFIYETVHGTVALKHNNIKDPYPSKHFGLAK